MRRLYLQIYLAFVAILILFGVLVAATWEATDRGGNDQRKLAGVSEFLGEAMPPRHRPPAEAAGWLARAHRRFELDLALYDERGEALATAGSVIPLGARSHEREWVRVRGGIRVTLPLPDGRRLVAFHRHPRNFRWLLVPALLAAAIAIGAYPLARRITRRLERLRDQVEALGAGDLRARVDMSGKDEVAALANSFNHAAERIERLVDGQRTLLASASHELRSPLTRVRMAIEGLEEHQGPLRERLIKDVGELDELIEELLLGSRLESIDTLPVQQSVELLGLTAEEGARVNAIVEGRAAYVSGDPRLLRRAVRNLFENARRYGLGTAITARIDRGLTDIQITISDQGPGIAAAHRERIFEPFYRLPGMREGVDRGVGLGLALVKQIAQHHGGTVNYLPSGTGGSSFVITLPAANDAEQESPAVSSH